MAVYVAVPLLATSLSIILSTFLEEDEFPKGSVKTIEHANNSFLPSYLGYFFVALSVNDIDTLLFVYGILFVFTYLSQALYFNPLFLIFRFEFYNITTTNGSSVFLISKEKYKIPTDIEISCSRRINDYTYIEWR